MKCAAVIVAGGTGTRAGTGGAEPKQYRRLGGVPMLVHALAPFLSHPQIATVQVVIRAGTEALYHEAISPAPRLLAPVAGGPRRQDSVRNGLEAIAGDAPDIVLIHDAARPFASCELINRITAALEGHAGAVPALPIVDTLKRGSPGGLVEGTEDRAGLFAVQTPQGFRYPEIRKAHARAATADEEFTDDAAIAEFAGMHVALVAGESMNRKLTTEEDFALAERLLSGRLETRTGSGYDVHRFADGDLVTLCGVSIPFERRLSGHSDADVGLHALTDALLGAIAEGDIGSHFPPSDSRWRGVDSAVFLARAGDLLLARGGRIVNLDVTLICEAPKIGPHRDAMRARIAEILRIDTERVAVKATTSEGLGFTGRREGIAAQATASVALPAKPGKR